MTARSPFASERACGSPARSRYAGRPHLAALGRFVQIAKAQIVFPLLSNRAATVSRVSFRLESSNPTPHNTPPVQVR